MRLSNINKIGKYEYRVILDTEKVSCNYIERSIGVHYDKVNGNHRCIKCMKISNWIHWNKANTKATDTCIACGQKHTLEIMSFDNAADVHNTPETETETEACADDPEPEPEKCEDDPEEEELYAYCNSCGAEYMGKEVYDIPYERQTANGNWGYCPNCKEEVHLEYLDKEQE